jgi:2-dehydropantoate 2-reductase
MLSTRATVIVADTDPAVRQIWRERGLGVLDSAQALGTFDYGADDAVILATKATVATAAIAPVPAEVPVISISNGFNAELTEARPQGLAHGVVDFAASLRAPGEIVCTRRGGLTLQRDSAADVTRRLAAALEGGEIEAHLVDDIDGYRWSKLLLNASFDPVATLTGQTFGEIFAHRPSLEVLRRLLAEGVAVARAAGIALYPVQGTSPASLSRILHTPILSSIAAFFAARQARTVESAMLADVRRGAPTEIAFLNGHVVRTAEQVGVSVPCHAKVMELIGEIDRGGRRPELDNARLVVDR